MLIDRDSQDFPECLREVKPIIRNLYNKGNWDKGVYEHSLSVVGSRRISSYGKRTVEKIIPELVNSNLIIVSGFMYGVDQVAHRSAVEMNGKTIAVLGWGIDRKLTRNDERQLEERILENSGAVVSEYGGEQEALRWMFAARNRIVAGLGRALLVVEAAVDSGSMITVNKAIDLGRKVMAVPGPIFSSVSEGTNQLIKEGRAIPVTTAADILGIMNIKPTDEEEKICGVGREGGVMKVLDNESLSRDEIIQLMEKDAAQVLREIGELELYGKIIREGDKYRKI